MEDVNSQAVFSDGLGQPFSDAHQAQIGDTVVEPEVIKARVGICFSRCCSGEYMLC